MNVSRTLLALMLLLGASLGFAQIGQPAAATLEGLLEQNLLETDSAEQFQLEPVLAGELLYRFSGRASASSQNLERLGEVVGHATGFGEQIAIPVRDFLEANLAGLIDAGSAVIPIEGNFLLELELTEDEADTAIIDWQFGLIERDKEAFLDARHALGADEVSARVVIREFADLQCPHCATFATEVMPLIKELLADDPELRFEFHHFPLVSIHANAIPAAEAAECVAAANAGTGTFFEFSTLIFERMQAWAQLPETAPYFVSLAQESGLATDGVAECLAERQHLAHVQDSVDHAARELGVQGTPTVFVDGFQVTTWNLRSGYEDLINLIDALSDGP